MTRYKAENGLLPYSSGREFMRHYREMTRDFEAYKPRQTVVIKGVMKNISKDEFDKICREEAKK